MSLRYVAGYQSNLLQRASSITVTNENSLLPKSYLYDGSGLAFAGSAEASPFNITVDLGQVPTNGGFESAFTAGLPGSGWAKTGGTISRNTAIPRTGAGCMQCDGNPSSDYAYFVIRMFAGQRFKFSAAARCSSPGPANARVRVRNLHTGASLLSDGTWTTANTDFILTTDSTYTFTSVTTSVQNLESMAPYMDVRFEFWCANSGGVVPVYDDVELLFGVNACSVHWSNIVGRGVNDRPELHSSTDNFSGSDTTEGTLTAIRPAFYVVLGSTVYRRYWRLSACRDAFLLNGGAAPFIGEFVLGYAEAGARSQDYGWELTPAFQQVRTSALGGQEAVYALGEFERRRLRMQFKPSAASEFLDLRDRLYRATRGGADPLVIVPYDSDDVVIHGRLGPELPHQRELVARWNLGLEVLETAPPIVTS